MDILIKLQENIYVKWIRERTIITRRIPETSSSQVNYNNNLWHQVMAQTSTTLKGIEVVLH